MEVGTSEQVDPNDRELGLLTVTLRGLFAKSLTVLFTLFSKLLQLVVLCSRATKSSTCMEGGLLVFGGRDLNGSLARVEWITPPGRVYPRPRMGATKVFLTLANDLDSFVLMIGSNLRFSTLLFDIISLESW